MREHIELRAGRATILLDDCSRYSAERGERIVRNRRFPKLDAHARMYRQIARRIDSDAQGDSLESLRSTAVMLQLDQQLAEAGGRR
jgi:hypothetical protein